jgi:hypothetical protein
MIVIVVLLYYTTAVTRDLGTWLNLKFGFYQ